MPPLDLFGRAIPLEG